MKKHLAAMAKEHDALKKAHESAAACHKELSECYKAEVAEGLRKATEKDHHEDLSNCHKAMSECHGRLGDNCRKAAALPADAKGGDGHSSDVELNLTGDDAAKVTGAIDSLRSDFEQRMQKFEKTLVPTQVRGVVPDVPGVQLVGRAGGPSAPVADLPPELAEMVKE